MKFGVREVTDIVFKTKVSGQQVGSATYPQYAPVMIVDSAKMSSMENTVSTVYAQGGKGNPRLLGWDGDRTATFKFEESIITTDGLAILTGSNIATGQSLYRQQIAFTPTATSITLGPNLPGISSIGATAATIAYVSPGAQGGVTIAGATMNLITLDATGDITTVSAVTPTGAGSTQIYLTGLTANTPYVLDFYVVATGKQLQVEAGKFAGYYYIEANTLFRDNNGTDHPAQITIPKGKVKSNFTLTMSPTGDPSTFAFEVDALPDYTLFVTDKKVLYTLDISNASANENL